MFFLFKLFLFDYFGGSDDLRMKGSDFINNTKSPSSNFFNYLIICQIVSIFHFGKRIPPYFYFLNMRIAEIWLALFNLGGRIGIWLLILIKLNSLFLRHFFHVMIERLDIVEINFHFGAVNIFKRDSLWRSVFFRFICKNRLNWFA